MRQIHGFQIGALLRGAIAVYGKNLHTIALLTLITYLPLIALMVFHPLPEPPAMPPPEDPEQSREYLSALLPVLRPFYESMIWYWVAIGLCSSWLQGGLTYVVVRALRSGPPSLAQAFWQSCHAIARVLVVGILVGVATVLGTLLFVVPGIIIALMLWVAIPAAVVERRYGSALRRSHELTSGHKWPILGIAILLGVFTFACGSVVPAILSDLAPRIVPLAEALVTAATASVSAVVGAVCYHDLRVLKEGTSANSVAKVFE